MSSRSTRSGKKILRKTFTYYIPAPQQRKSGYREREFDKIMQGILSSGFELESLQTQATGGEPGGLFVVAVLKTSSQKVFDSDREQDIQESFRLSHTPSSPDFILDEEDDA